MKQQQTLKTEYPWNLLNAAFGESFDKACMDKKAVARGLEFILYTDVSPRNRNILELRYRDEKNVRYIAERYNMTTDHVKHIISNELLKMQYPSRAAYLLHGCTDGVAEAEQRKREEDARAAAEKAAAERKVREAKALAEALLNRRPGMFRGSILSIADPYERLDAIFARGGAEPLEKTQLPQSILKALKNSGDHITTVYQLCFLTYLDVMFLNNVGNDGLLIVEEELNRLDLALDNGLLSDPRAKQQYLRYAKAQQGRTALLFET